MNSVTKAVVLAGLALALCFPAVGIADWDNTPAKWVQLPDLSPNGIDVNATAPMFLANDWQCTSPGAVTNIHIWGSWYHNAGDPNAVMFTLTIYDDIPTNESPTGYSMPGKAITNWFFQPGTFRVVPWAQGPQEGWYDPSQGSYEFPADDICWQYNFPIPPGEQFVQQGTRDVPKVYWLGVQAAPLEPGTFFGWKTTDLRDVWNDDAVWGVGDVPPWFELTYPPPHEWAPQSMDLAFVIESEEEQQLDFGDAPDGAAAPGYPTWLVNNGARHIIGGPWLGSDAGDGHQDAPDPEADGQSDLGALGDDTNNVPPMWDDEDGAWFPRLMQGVATNYTVIVNGGGGVVQIWLDLNGNKTWEHPGEMIHSAFHTNGTYLLPITAPTNSTVGSTFARCRISLQGGLLPVGLAPNGEVEDHNVFIDSGYVAWCNLQWPPSTTTQVGVATENICGQVWEPGITDAPGQGAGIIAQLGYGPDGTGPVGNPAWTWVNAAFNLDVGNNDEYMANLTVPAAGRYDYAYRFSRNGGIQWSYGDLSGSGDGYQIANAGDLVVEKSMCPKWLQEPDCKIGLDVQSWRTDRLNGGIVADDWLCDGRPITAIRWWGSYVYDKMNEPGEFPPPQFRPIGFELTWYKDIPAGEKPPWSTPGEIIRQEQLLLGYYGEPPTRPGIVSETYCCTSDLTGLEPGRHGYEHEYEYYVELPSPWNEKEGTIYWLSIQAVYIEPPVVPPIPDNPAPPWGWKTTPVERNWNDDAVIQDEAHRDWTEMLYPPPVAPWMAITNHPYAGESVNMAFELLTDVCPRRAKKWAQPPDMLTGENMPSFTWLNEPRQGLWSLRADDFISDGRPITDIHWWGSYLGYEMHTTNEVPAPLPPYAPLGFRLSWHADIPEDPSFPGNPPIKEVFAPLAKCHEVYYGPVAQWWLAPGPLQEFPTEHEFQYYVDLLDPEMGGPWNETNQVVYWVNIQAVFQDSWEPGQSPHQGWGWKSAHPTNGYRDISVVATNLEPGGGQPVWIPGLYPDDERQYAKERLNLAFELTTDKPGIGPIAFTNIAFGPTNHYIMGSVGDAGAGSQCLESSANLLVSNWVAVATNPVPLPPPYTNVWPKDSARSNEFFRIHQK